MSLSLLLVSTCPSSSFVPAIGGMGLASPRAAPRMHHVEGEFHGDPNGGTYTNGDKYTAGPVPTSVGSVARPCELRMEYGRK